MRNTVAALAAALFAVTASAQTEITAISEAQRLACLAKPPMSLRYPQRNVLDRSEGAMRLQLKFTSPSAPPAVQVLYNTAREDMQSLVYDYVAGYRLPCLRPQDGDVSAVQEFTFRKLDRDPEPVPSHGADGDRPACVVAPRRDMAYMTSGARRSPVEHVIAELTFSGDGEQPPEVKHVYAKASGRFKQAVHFEASDYRMPCRTAKDKPQVFQVRFSMLPDSKRRAAFQRERFSLMEFLAMTREPAKLRAYFDLATMNCPFSVQYTIGNEEWPNEAVATGPADPNRAVFLAWLRSLQLQTASSDMANDLFGSKLQIDVPCGVLNLEAGPAAGGG